MDENKLYEKIASQYVELCGEKLLREADEIPSLSTPGLDKKVSLRMKMGKLRRNLAGLGTLVATLLLLLLLPRMLQIFSGNEFMAEPSSGVMEESSAGGIMTPSLSPVEEEGGNQVEIEALPLNVTLPHNFDVVEVEVDQGQTIYHLAETSMDHVVLTLRETDEKPEVEEGLQEIVINDKTVYGSDRGDYRILLFEKEGILYEMTCKHDINTLIQLSSSIL